MTTFVPVYGATGIRAFAVVDAEDYELAMRHRWNLRDGYVVSRERSMNAERRRPLICLHRLILGLGADSPLEAHHVNRNKLDNRRANLQALTTKDHAATRRKVAA